MNIKTFIITDKVNHMDFIEHTFNQEFGHDKDKVDIMNTWESIFGDRIDVPKTWNHFLARLVTLDKSVSLEELIEAMEKGRFFKTLKALYSEIIRIYSSERDYGF